MQEAVRFPLGFACVAWGKCTESLSSQLFEPAGCTVKYIFYIIHALMNSKRNSSMRALAHTEHTVASKQVFERCKE